LDDQRQKIQEEEGQGELSQRLYFILLLMCVDQIPHHLEPPIWESLSIPGTGAVMHGGCELRPP
jgi:hypothetical protein